MKPNAPKRCTPCTRLRITKNQQLRQLISRQKARYSQEVEIIINQEEAGETKRKKMMKKNNFYLLTLIVITTWLSACNNNDITAPEQVNTQAPILRGSIGQLSESKSISSTKSGVIEDNNEYSNGEQFYWVNGDKVKMLFFLDGDISKDPQILEYTANVPSGKPNSCDFTTSGSLSEGEYTTYGLYPADGWSNIAGKWTASASSEALIQTDATSQHIGKAMFMKGRAANITVGAEGTAPMDMNFKHLGAAVRLRITNQGPTSLNPELLSVKLSTAGGSELFPQVAHLSSIDDTELDVETRLAELEVTVNQPFPATPSYFDVFMPMLATGQASSGERLIISGRSRYTEGSTPIEKTETYTPSGGIPFSFISSDVDSHGFEAGKSYYFNLKNEAVSEGNIIFNDADFKAELIKNDNIDLNKDDEISYAEAASYAGEIDLSMKTKVDDIREIQYFTNISELNCSYSNISSLDVSKNTKLTTLDCSNNSKINSLDVSKNTLIKHLSCYKTEISTLDISKIPELDYLSCSNTNISELDVSLNTKLSTLHAKDTPTLRIKVNTTQYNNIPAGWVIDADDTYYTE